MVDFQIKKTGIVRKLLITNNQLFEIKIHKIPSGFEKKLLTKVGKSGYKCNEVGNVSYIWTKFP